MAGMSVDGLISGLDTTSLINQLIQAEAAPQTSLKNKVSEAQAAVSAYQSINTRYAALATAAEAIANPDTWTTPVTSSSSASVKASSTATATLGRLDFDVTSVARSHSLATGTFSDINDIVQTWPVVLTGDKGGMAFAITATDNSVSGLINAINTATGVNGASLDLQAVVVQVAPGTYRLQITAKDTGEASQFTLDGLGATSVVRTGTDAEIDLGGGLTVKSATNTFTDVLPGTTFTVSKEETGVSVSTAVTAESIADKVAAMVNAANAALAEAAKQSTYDTASKKGAPLVGEAAIRTLQSQTLGAVDVVAGAGAPGTAGIGLDRNGRLTFDRARFVELMAEDPARAQALAAGVGASLAAVAKGATDSTSGSVTLAIQGRDAAIKDLGTRIENWDTRLSARKAALVRQFSAMETALSSLRNQSSWLSGQLASLPTWGSQ
ncbi:flagellar filament capping protein FliD [Sporichthya brevicatena]|uniref:Flagellar hook-associated protein 2 n=1 Tax=Sporichthya brevicatena TaxID=171442 RepID=A0ABN1GDM8_9ACTN